MAQGGHDAVWAEERGREWVDCNYSRRIREILVMRVEGTG